MSSFSTAASHLTINVSIYKSTGYYLTVSVAQGSAQPRWVFAVSSRSMHTWLLAGFTSSWAVGLRASVPLWLLTGSCPQSLAQGPLQQGSLLHPSAQAEKAMQLASKKRVTILCRVITEATAHHLCHILLLRRPYVAQPHSEGGEYPKRR